MKYSSKTTNNPVSNEETFSEKETFKVEFLIAKDDKTWDTEIFDVPLSLEDSSDKDIEYWWLINYMSYKKYEQVVAVTIYNFPDEEVDGH